MINFQWQKRCKFLAFTLLIAFQAGFIFPGSAEAVPIIPGVYGFGTETPGGRGGQIYRVTNLNDSGAGSLRAALEASGKRIVVFEVSGNIDLNSNININDPYLTVAGQTAPSPGISIIGGYTVWIFTHDVVFQHLRIRTGDGAGNDLGNRASLNLAHDTAYNIVIDHCSLSWGSDANMDIWGNIDNVTLSNSINSEGLYMKGGIVGGGAKNVSYINNLFAHNEDRNPYMRSSGTVVVNNLIYNPKYHSTIIRDNKNPVKSSAVGNVLLPGPNTSAAKATIDLVDIAYPSQTRIFADDNACPSGTGWACVAGASSGVRASSPPVWPKGLVAMPSSKVKDYVLTQVGARPADRDPVDVRIMNDVKNKTGRIITSHNDVGGWPNLAQNKRALTVPADPNGDSDNDGYTNVEEWLHTMAAQVEGGAPAPPPPPPPTADTVKPSVPTGLTATVASNSQLDLSWTAATDDVGVVGYKIYRNGTLLTTTAKTAHSDTGLASATTYSYTVSAYDAASNESGQSGAVSKATMGASTIFSLTDPVLGDVNNWEPLTAARWGLNRELESWRYGITTTDFVNLPGGRPGEYSLIKGATYTDFTLKATVRSTEDLTVNDRADYVVLFGFKDPSNYYYAMFTSGPTGCKLVKIANGSDTVLAQQTAVTIPDNGWHQVTVERIGANIKVGFDGKTILTAADSTFGAGRLGIGGFNDASLWDDIVVLPTPPTSLRVVN